MAIKYTRGKKELEYTGIDKAMHSFGNTLERIKSVGKKAVTAIPRALERKSKADAAKELDDISRGFGSVENYEKLYPETKKRHDMLRKRAFGK